MGKILKKYINKIGYTYYMAFIEFPSIRKNKRYNTLIRVKSSALTQLKIE